MVRMVAEVRNRTPMEQRCSRSDTDTRLVEARVALNEKTGSIISP